MLRSQIPTRIGVSFASGAGPSFIQNPIPVSAQPNGRAAFTTGFSELNFDPLASGGIPPWGKDFNGLMFLITDWLRFAAAAGGPVGYDASFQSTVGGYPQYALIRSSSGDRFWLSTVDNNLTNPDTGGAGWIKFPDVIVQKQAGNYAVDIGSVNAFRVTLDPLPSSLAAIVGSPIRFLSGAANTIATPTILIDNVAGDPAIPVINSNGANLLIGQISRAGQICEGFVDNTGKFQLTNPTPIAAPATSGLITGMIYCWSTEVLPPGVPVLECNGATYNIVTYPNLFNVIGTRYGGDGVNNFKVPDLRGAFIRGWDHGRGLDPNASARTTAPGGGTVAGDHVGSWQLSAVGPFSMAGALLNPIAVWAAALQFQGLPVPGGERPVSIDWSFISNGAYDDPPGSGGIPSGRLNAPNLQTPNVFGGTLAEVIPQTFYLPAPRTQWGYTGQSRAYSGGGIDGVGSPGACLTGSDYQTQGPDQPGAGINLDRIKGTLTGTGSSSETRPTNIYEMFVIAY